MDQNPSNEFSARIKYDYVVERLEEISKTKDRDRKTKILENCFKEILRLQQQFYDQHGQEADANGSFYPFLRLFIPTLDIERGSFGIQIKTLGQKFVQALGINAKSDAAKKLTDLHGSTMDYGDVVYDVMKNRSPSKGTLTVYEVNKYLDLMADHFKDNQRSKIEAKLVQMLNKMSALDRKWLTRTLLKKLDLGIGKKYIMELYHPKAWDLYNQHSHLSRVCQVIESKVPLEKGSGFIEIFKPIRPMLCERGYVSQINKMLIENDYYLETKMDGERCQLHVQGTEFKYFSRSCREDGLTKAFGASGATSSGGLYSPFLYLQLNGKIKSAIFDGEMMVWDRQDEIFCKKAEKFTAKHLKANDNRYNPCFCIYDLIYLDGESLINKPYAERIRKLQTIIIEKKGALMLCHRTKVKTATHFLECLNKAFESNEEGVVIKQEGSKYKPGYRENGGWFKMKPDYENNLINDFDLLIIGGYYNDNKTGVDSFLLAVLKKGRDENDSRFHSVCKIRNGLSRSHFREILEKLASVKHEKGSFQNPESFGIEWANANPDFWYEPKHSIIIQIKASELTETTKYRTSHSFRFPRVMEIRWDKMWYDTCTLNEFQTFCSSDSKVEKLTKRHATANDLAGGSVPKRRRVEASKGTQSVASTSNQADAVDNICQGREFCIVSKLDSLKELEEMVRRHGGRTVAYPTSKTFVIIVSNPKSLQAKKFIDKKEHNIANVQWLTRALGSDKPLTNLMKFTPDDMVFMTPALREQFDAESNANADTDSEPMFHSNSIPTPEQSMDQIVENDEAVVENNETQQDIFEQVDLLEPDVSTSQHVQSVIRDEFDAATNEPIATVLQVEPIVTDNEIQPEANNDPIYEEATQLMDNDEEISSVTNAHIEHENNDQSKQTNNDDTEMEQTTEEPDEMNIFRKCIAYFYTEESSSMDCDATFAQFMFSARGGTTLKTEDDIRNSELRLTHIFVANANFDRSKLKEAVKSFGTNKLENIIVRYQWILDCNDQMKRICDTSYKVNL